MRKKQTPEYIRERNRIKRLRQQDIVKAAKDKLCADCGLKYPPYVMDFDHRDGTEKKWNIGNLPGRSGIASLIREIAKCDVVCSNCHRERTYGDGKWSRERT